MVCLDLVLRKCKVTHCRRHQTHSTNRVVQVTLGFRGPELAESRSALEVRQNNRYVTCYRTLHSFSLLNSIPHWEARLASSTSLRLYKTHLHGLFLVENKHCQLVTCMLSIHYLVVVRKSPLSDDDIAFYTLSLGLLTHRIDLMTLIFACLCHLLYCPFVRELPIMLLYVG